MAYLTLNGFDIRANDMPRADDSGYVRQRTPNGAVFTNHYNRSHSWRVQTALFPMSEIHAITSWLEGRGHRWSFDHATQYEYSSKGQGIATGTYTRATGGIGAKFGAAYLDVTASSTIAMGSGYSSAWTVAYWINDGGAWEHRIETSDGDQWEDGVSGSYGWSISMSGGTLTLPAGDYDDVVILPYVITSAMGDGWPQSSAFSALDKLVASGDFNPAGNVNVFIDPPEVNPAGKAVMNGTMQHVFSLDFEMVNADVEYAT